MPDHFNVTEDVPDSERVLNLFERVLNLFESLMLIAVGICLGFVAAMFVPGVFAC